ncbi:MAG TPA: GAF domain-containing protein, partial [Syntrophorhabdaceae bacterium]|nr:GAF domain-containing protein [Syntrophorhabdaceae bacterium]
MLDERQKLQEILDIDTEVMRIKDIDILLEKLLTRARDFTDADAGSIYIKENNTLRFKYTQNETEEKRLPPGKKLVYSSFSIPVDNKSIAGYVAATGETLNIPDVNALRSGTPYSFDSTYDHITGYHTHSVLAFPLRAHGNDIVGVLQLINAKTPDNGVAVFDKRDEPFILHFANNAALA